MKLPFILFCLIIQCNIYAQSKNILKLNSTDLVIGRYSIGYEKNIGHSMSIALDLDILNQNKTLESSHPWYPPLDVTKKGIVVEPQIRYYFNKNGLQGLYTSLSGVFGIAEYQPTTPSGFIENDDWSSVGASLSLGYQLLIKIGQALQRNAWTKFHPQARRMQVPLRFYVEKKIWTIDPWSGLAP